MEVATMKPLRKPRLFLIGLRICFASSNVWALEIGDEFDVQRKMGMGGSGVGMQAETLIKQVFTREDVRKGLAYFSVKERSVTKTGGAMGGQL